MHMHWKASTARRNGPSSRARQGASSRQYAQPSAQGMQALEEDEGPASSPPGLLSSLWDGLPASASPVETQEEDRRRLDGSTLSLSDLHSTFI